MTKKYLFLIFLLLPLHLWSQEDISIGKKYSIYSTILQEERDFWIHLPDNYNPADTLSYPVIYLLDGELFFHSLVGISKTISSSKNKFLPESIIVGVISKDRTKDMTPVASTIGRNGKSDFFETPQGGGSERFNQFLTEELRDKIQSEYKTNGKNTLVGHSYAGLFTLNTFLKHTVDFDKYIIIDPSLWWNGGSFMEEAKSIFSQKSFEGKDLYIAIASKERKDRDNTHVENAKLFFNTILPKAKNLFFVTKLFPEENHGTIGIPGIYDGLKQLYNK